MGHPHEGSFKAINLAWNIWEEHTLRCTDYHDGRCILEVVFIPTVAQLAHYLGERWQKGKTAATGVYAGLWRFSKALGSGFPMSDDTLKGWGKHKLGHRVTQ